MELSYFLAQLMGFSLAIFAVVGLIRPRIVSDAVRKFDTSPLTALLFGFGGIVVGLAIILTHNIWEYSWRGAITVVGWASLIKGITYMLAPNVLLKIGNSVYRNDLNIRVVLLIAFVAGMYLASKGLGT